MIAAILRAQLLSMRLRAGTRGTSAVFGVISGLVFYGFWAFLGWTAMLFFSLLVVVVFSFSFDPNAEESRQIAGGLVWVAFLFAAVVAQQFDCLSRVYRARLRD